VAKYLKGILIMPGIARTGENVGANIEYFTCYTLIDISDTGVFDPAGGPSYEQAQNLNALLQAISLGSQPILASVEKLTAADVADFAFGSDFSGAHNVWILRFASERVGSITVDSLIRDVDGLPVYDDLDETATFESASVFETDDPTQKNIYFIRNDNL
jgi:hypothetical protein